MEEETREEDIQAEVTLVEIDLEEVTQEEDIPEGVTQGEVMQVEEIIEAHLSTQYLIIFGRHYPLQPIQTRREQQ